MLALIEPFMVGLLPDRPNLGCAMLAASLRKRGHEVKLVVGQSRWLRDLLLFDHDETWQLIVDQDDQERLGRKHAKFRARLLHLGQSAFRDKLNEWHTNLIERKSVRHYLDSEFINELAQFVDLTIRTLSYYIKHKKHDDISIINRYIQAVELHNPDRVGVSLTRMPNVLVQAIINAVRKRTGLPFVFGGWITPFLSHEDIKFLLAQSPHDCLAIGLADETLPNLLEALHERHAPESISGVFRLENGTIIGRPVDGLPKLQDLPYPDYSDYDLDAFFVPNRILPYQTARGCSWNKCSFCAHSSIYQGHYQRADIEYVVNGINHLRDTYDASHIVLHDEELPPKRAEQISDALLTQGTSGVYFYANTRLIRQYDNVDLLAKMYRAGFRTLVWGMESGSQRTLDRMRKNTHIDEMSNILKKAADVGIGNICFVMFGHPGETVEEANETTDFLQRHASVIALRLTGVFEVAVFSPIHNSPATWGIELREDLGWTASQGMTAEEATQYHERFLAREGLGQIESCMFPHLLANEISRMLVFLCRAHGMVSGAEREKVLDGTIDDIIPVLLGQEHRSAGDLSMRLIDTSKTLLVNNLSKPRLRNVPPLEKRVFDLADGTRSVADIARKVKDDVIQYPMPSVDEFIHCYIAEMLKEYSGYAFKQMWVSAPRTRSLSGGLGDA